MKLEERRIQRGMTARQLADIVIHAVDTFGRYPENDGDAGELELYRAATAAHKGAVAKLAGRPCLAGRGDLPILAGGTSAPSVRWILP